MTDLRDSRTVTRTPLSLRCLWCCQIVNLSSSEAFESPVLKVWTTPSSCLNWLPLVSGRPVMVSVPSLDNPSDRGHGSHGGRTTIRAFLSLHVAAGILASLVSPAAPQVPVHSVPSRLIIFSHYRSLPHLLFLDLIGWCGSWNSLARGISTGVPVVRDRVYLPPVDRST